MEFFLIAFSTFLGAGVALAADRLGRGRDAKLAEEAAINNLIIDLAAKRVFLVDEDWVLVEDEMGRIADSMMHTRGLIRDARIALRPRSKALPHLRAMTRACNTFLEMSERAEDLQLKKEAKRMAQEVTDEVAALHALRPKRIFSDRPGSAALNVLGEPRALEHPEPRETPTPASDDAEA